MCIQTMFNTGSATRLQGSLLILSGKDGTLLHSAIVPDGRESYYSPVLLTRRGMKGVLFGTGGETHGGSLWWVTLDDLYKSGMNKVKHVAS
jgi:hypothetical protein